MTDTERDELIVRIAEQTKQNIGRIEKIEDAIRTFASSNKINYGNVWAAASCAVAIVFFLIQKSDARSEKELAQVTQQHEKLETRYQSDVEERLRMLNYLQLRGLVTTMDGFKSSPPPPSPDGKTPLPFPVPAGNVGKP